jgi:hypothetical protein
LAGAAPDQPVPFEEQPVDDLTPLGPSDRHSGEHIHPALLEQRPRASALAQAALIRDPQLEDPSLLTLGGPGLQRGPPKVGGQPLASRGHHVCLDPQREPDLGVGALPIDPGGDGVDQLPTLFEEPVQRCDAEVSEGLGDHPLIHPGIRILPGGADQPARAGSAVPALPHRRDHPPQRCRLQQHGTQHRSTPNTV